MWDLCEIEGFSFSQRVKYTTYSLTHSHLFTNLSDTSILSRDNFTEFRVDLFLVMSNESDTSIRWFNLSNVIKCWVRVILRMVTYNEVFLRDLCRLLHNRTIFNIFRYTRRYVVTSHLNPKKQTTNHYPTTPNFWWWSVTCYICKFYLKNDTKKWR